MNLDDKVCYCFHVTRRKLVNWVRLNAPKVPSQLSECGGAGTGCGWCVPFLKQIFTRAVQGGVIELETWDAAEYERRDLLAPDCDQRRPERHEQDQNKQDDKNRACAHRISHDVICCSRR